MFPMLRRWAYASVCALIFAAAVVRLFAQAPPPNADSAEETARLAAERENLDRTLWADEVAAQRHEQVFIKLWDDLRAATDKFAPLASFPFSTLAVGAAQPETRHDWDIRVTQLGEPKRNFNAAEYRAWIDTWRKEGYRIVEGEWHHSQFTPATDKAPAKSIVSMTLHAEHVERQERFIVKGRLSVTWKATGEVVGLPAPDHLEAVDFRIVSRKGTPAFDNVITETLAIDPSGRSAAPPTTHPLLVYDLDGDGRSEIVLAGANRVYRNLGGGRFGSANFCKTPAKHVNAGVLADFTGDGNVDFLAGGLNDEPRLFVGDGKGRFPDAGVPIRTGVDMRLPTAIAAGDIDGDGDLDAWIGQYKPPYVYGSMPTPYFDANDGFPAVLLVNEGGGKFRERTAEAGLAKKRFRRTYSASFIDLDGDRDLDLIVVSDFSGIDAYLNDGKGNFADATDELFAQRHLFGMSHTFGDYDNDGHLDVYVVGMSSTTARRLDLLRAGRAERQFADHNRLRKEMGYGNRLFMGNLGEFAPWGAGDQIARTGWSWGSTSADFDNDGDVDIFVANGNRSGKSARDYCTRYWCHDAYTGTSQENPAAGKLFLESLSELNQHEISWNGFEHDVLWMNEGGKSFLDVAFLMGVAFESDGRAVASDDLDGDGRAELIVEEFDQIAGRMNLRVMHNRWPGNGHWIGVRLADGVAGRSPVGAEVTVELPGGRKRVVPYVTGHSVWTQHAAAAHFGLGAIDAVEGLSVRWPNGATTRLETPAIDRYHTLAPPKIEGQE